MNAPSDAAPQVQPDDAPRMRPYGHHLLICEHGDCAEPEAALRLQARFRQLVQAHGLNKLRNPERVKCTLSECLGVCGGGPILVVYPDGIWYHHVDETLLERIVQEHILTGRPVEEAVFHRQGESGGDGQVPFTADRSGDITNEKVTATSESGSHPEDSHEIIQAGTQLTSSAEADTRRKASRGQRKQKGLVIVNTGNGKGKTTAALGILTRAWGREMRVGGIQFFKHENANFGELRAMERMGVMLTPMGDGFTWTSRDLDETQAKALHGWEKAKARILSGNYDIFLLDEFTYLLHFGWLDAKEVVAWLQAHKPPLMHLIITGRDAAPELIAMADLVTEMREIKHPFRQQGIRAQKGIEF
jgi:cob(I)alamin adenosyltransferase